MMKSLGAEWGRYIASANPPWDVFFFQNKFLNAFICIQARHSNELYCAWSYRNWGYDMNFFLLLPWFLGLFCILSHNAGVLPRCLFLPCSVFCRELLADWTPQEKQAKLWWIRYQWWVNCDIWRRSTWSKIIEILQQGRIGEIEEIANLATYLCSDYARWIQVLLYFFLLSTKSIVAAGLMRRRWH